MAQTGFTPIVTYNTATATTIPSAANLAQGELAVNVTDKKLYTKDGGGNVVLLASNGGDVTGPASSTNLAIPTFSGTGGKTLLNNSGVTISAGVVAGTGFTGALNGSLGATTPSTAVVTSINKMAITAPATSSTLAVADGKTLTASNSLTLAGTDATTMTFPTTSATIARTDAAQTFTGTQTFSALSVANIVGTTYAQTSTASPYSIVDTGIVQATTNTGYGYQAIYEIFVVGNPYAVGSATYSTSIAGLIFISNGYNGASVGQYISFTQLGISTVPVFPPQLTMSVVFWDGSTESTFSTSASAQIRIKVSYTDTGNIGYSQIVNITKRV
jgi:hypothetical protein